MFFPSPLPPTLGQDADEKESPRQWRQEEEKHFLFSNHFLFFLSFPFPYLSDTPTEVDTECCSALHIPAAFPTAGGSCITHTHMYSG